MCSESRIPIPGEWVLDRVRAHLGMPPLQPPALPALPAPDPEEAAAEAFAQEDAAVRRFRQAATDAIVAQDWRAFFAACADCARAMNARGRILEQAPVGGAITPRREELAAAA